MHGDETEIMKGKIPDYKEHTCVHNKDNGHGMNTCGDSYEGPHKMDVVIPNRPICRTF